MKSFYRFSALLLVLYFLVSATTLWANFNVVSITPVNGAANIDTTATLIIEFDQAVDTSANFLFPSDFFLGLKFFPDTLVNEPDSIYFSADFKTVYLQNLHLADNQLYWFLINKAVSLSGDSLTSPYGTIFSTGNSVPSGQISGSVSYPQGNPENSIVILLDRNPVEGEGGVHPINSGIVPPGGSTYQMNYVADGTYWPFVVKNVQFNDDDIIFNTNSALGFYDMNADFMPDSIEIVNGSMVGNVNLSMVTITKNTARHYYNTLEPIVLNWASDAQLINLSGDPDFMGNGEFWDFAFYSPSLAEYQLWISVGGIFIRGSLYEPIEDTTAITPNWIDSDALLAITEANGGFEFRQMYPNAEIYCQLGYINYSSMGPFENFSQKSIQKYLEKQIKKNSVNNTNEGVRFSLWTISYDADTANIVFIIDPITGDILSDPCTAKDVVQNANIVANAWAPDAELYTIESADSVDSEGTSQYWTLTYYSADSMETRQIFTWGQFPVADYPVGILPVEFDPLPANWMDSDSSIAVAEMEGGAAYRMANPDAFVFARLQKYNSGPHAGMTIWSFEYSSLTSPSEVYLVDAINGSLVNIENPELSQNVPQKLTLQQNYPNPFNPQTTIYYSLPNAGLTELMVYNILGQQVAVLVNENQIAGKHLFYWKPENLASGQYYLVLRFNNSQLVRKIQFLK